MAKIRSKILGKVTHLKLTQKQYEELRDGGLTSGKGGPQGNFARILATVRTTTGEPIAHVTNRELEGLRTATNLRGGGGWQDWAREVLSLNELT